MTILQRISSVFDKRSEGTKRPADDDDRWYSPFIASTASGIHVTAENAASTVAVYSAVCAIAQTIGSLPLITYLRQSNGGRERATASPFYSLFAAQPNDWMTSGEWVEMIFVHLLLRGNAYNFKLRDRSGRVVALVPLNPARMEVEQLDDLSVNYRYTFRTGQVRNMNSREVMQFRTGFSDGIVGRSPITVARETVALTIATERYAGRFFKNSARPSGVLTHPEKLDKPTSDRIRESWQRAHSGEENMWKVAVLEEGMKFEPITMSGRDSQFLEQRQFQLQDVARMFRVPPHIIGDLSRATFSNIEHQSINFVTYCLMPYIRRFEQTLSMNFFKAPVNGKEMYAEFLVDGLLRGDAKSRQESYEIMRRNGVLSANEWRRLENMSPTEDGVGDKFLVPMNMTWAELLGSETAQETEPSQSTQPQTPSDNEDPAPNDDVESERQRTLTSHARGAAVRMFAEILERMIYKETENLERLAKRDNPNEKIEEFMQKHESVCRSALETPIRFYSAALASIQERDEAIGAVDSLWNHFWSSYRSGVGQRAGVRSVQLSEKLCGAVDLIYSHNGILNGV